MIERINNDCESSTKIKVDSDEFTKDYESGAQVLASIAEEISGIPIPKKTLEDWRTLLASVRIVDDRLDHIYDNQERSKFEENMIRLLKGENINLSNDTYLKKASQDVIKLLSTLDDNQKKYFINSISNFFEITEKIKIEDDEKEYVKLTRLEGQIASRVFISFLPEEFKQSNNYQKLLHAMTRLGRMGNSFDNLIDFKSDYAENQIKIKPNILNRALLLGAILTDGASILKDGVLSRNTVKDTLLLAGKHIKSAVKKSN
ncbi:MAG: hypothetical protein NTV03_00325 [Candidatus Nomurabacteria bacterium]|nr:hypothetical protein [Candidatus Nomurabacteria bacterium]